LVVSVISDAFISFSRIVRWLHNNSNGLR
jgi:hypothetical protein